MTQSIEFKRARNLVNLSINSAADTALAIYAHPHWLLQLKQVALQLRKHEEFISSIDRNQRKIAREIRAQAREIQILEEELQQAILSPDGVEKDRKLEEIADLKEAASDQIQALSEEQRASERSRRDAKFLLETVLNIESKILSEHPDIQDMSYEEIQQRYGTEVLVERLSRQAAVPALARRIRLSPAETESLMNLPDHLLSEVVKRREEILQASLPSSNSNTEAIHGE